MQNMLYVSYVCPFRAFEFKGPSSPHISFGQNISCLCPLCLSLPDLHRFFPFHSYPHMQIISYISLTSVPFLSFPFPPSTPLLFRSLSFLPFPFLPSRPLPHITSPPLLFTILSSPFHSIAPLHFLPILYLAPIYSSSSTVTPHTMGMGEYGNYTEYQK